MIFGISLPYPPPRRFSKFIYHSIPHQPLIIYPQKFFCGENLQIHGSTDRKIKIFDKKIYLKLRSTEP